MRTSFEIARVVARVSDVRQLGKVPIRHRQQCVALRRENCDWIVVPESNFGGAVPEFGSEYQVYLDELISASPLVWCGTVVRRVSPPLPPLGSGRKPCLVDASCLARQGERRDDHGRPAAWNPGAPLLFAVCQTLDFVGWKPILFADGNLGDIFRRAGDDISVHAVDRVRWMGLASRGESARWEWRSIEFAHPESGAPSWACGRDVADRALLRAATGEFPEAPLVTMDKFRGLAERESEFRWSQTAAGQSRMAPVETFGTFFTVPALGFEGLVAREIFE